MPGPIIPRTGLDRARACRTERVRPHTRLAVEFRETVRPAPGRCRASPTADHGGSVPPCSGSLRRSSIVSESETPVPASTPADQPAETATDQTPDQPATPPTDPAPEGESQAPAAETASTPEEAPAAPAPTPKKPTPGTAPKPSMPSPAALAAKKPSAALLPVAPPVTEYDPEQIAAASEFGTVAEDGTVTVQDGTQVRTV